MVHVPVLLDEVISYLNPKKGETVLDATLDGGGHAMVICKKIGPEGRLVGIEQDLGILKDTEKRMLNIECGITLINGNFRNLDELLKNKKIGSIDAALFDLGMSSLQLEESGRGFSFLKDEPLIMTYKSELGPGDISAADILNKWPEGDIAEILREYGEERYAGRISRNIVRVRKEIPFATTFDLVEAIKKSVPYQKGRRRIHPATRTFQALRIAVNDEMAALKEGLEKSWRALNAGGRLVVVSFHSLEDRLVKNFLREKKNGGEGNILTKKPVGPSEDEEVKRNPRARSAKLRAIIKK